MPQKVYEIVVKITHLVELVEIISSAKGTLPQTRNFILRRISLV